MPLMASSASLSDINFREARNGYDPDQVDAFRDLEVFKQDVTEFAAYLKETPTAAGFDQVYYPGEVEHLRKQERIAAGVEIEDGTWSKLSALADKLGLPALSAA